MAAILEKLGAFWAGKKKTAWEQYKAFVLSLADDKDVDLDTLADTMRTIKRDEDQLADDIAHVQQRKQQRAVAQRLPADLVASKAADAKLVEFREKQEKITKELNEAGWEVDQITTSAESNLRQSQAAERKLVEECRDEELLTRNSELAEQRKVELAELVRQRDATAKDKDIVYREDSADWGVENSRENYDRWHKAKAALHSELCKKLQERTAFYEAEQIKLAEEKRCSPL